MQPPATDALPHRVGRFRAHCRCKTDEELSRTILRRSRAKRVAQKVEALFGIVVPPIGILAVHDLSLVWVKFQVPLSQSLLKRVSEGSRLHFASAVTDDVVSVAFEGDVGVLVRHPPIEGVMEKQVAQERADHRALGCALTPFH